MEVNDDARKYGSCGQNFGWIKTTRLLWWYLGSIFQAGDSTAGSDCGIRDIALHSSRCHLQNPAL
jgi:hypothetical protein